MSGLSAVRLAFLAVLLPVAATAAAEEPSLNAAVVRFCDGTLGKQVGDGSCEALVGEALSDAGAAEIDDAWGTPVERVEDVRPGDVADFRGAKFLVVGVGGTRRFRINERHVAVVARNRGGGRFDIYEQNVATAGATADRRAKTRKGVFDLRELVAGKVTFFRPTASR